MLSVLLPVAADSRDREKKRRGGHFWARPLNSLGPLFTTFSAAAGEPPPQTLPLSLLEISGQLTWHRRGENSDDSTAQHCMVRIRSRVWADVKIYKKSAFWEFVDEHVQRIEYETCKK